MSTAINIPIATDLLRRCTSCKVALPSSCIWKTCDKCREKSRVKQRNKTEQNKQRVAMLLLNGQTQISNMDVLNLKRKQAVDDETRKLKKLKVALAQVGPATAPSPGIMSKPPATSIQVSSEQSDSFKEYQSMASMQPFIQAFSPRFEGRFSIVASASLNHAARARIVATEIQPILPRMYFDPSKNAYGGGTNGPEKFTLLMKCKCTNKCPGRVTVTVRDDKSHPVLLGQCISLIIKSAH